MNKFIKYLLYFLVALAIILAIGWFAFLNVPKASSQGKTADFQLSSAELFQAFEQDEAAANTKYIGKIIELSGTIEDISEDEQGAAVVLLSAGEDALGGVLCTMELSEKEKTLAKQPGESIRLKGVCTGMLMEVVLNKGVLLE